MSDVNLIIAATKKRDRQSTNRRRTNRSTKPVMSIQTEINGSGNTGKTHQECRDDSGNALCKNHRVDSLLLGTPSRRFHFGLLKDPINAIWTDVVQPLNSGNWQKRRIGMVVLNNHLFAIFALNVCGCLPAAHASRSCANRAQRQRNHHASGLHPSQTHAGLADSRAKTATRSSRPLHC